MLSVVLTLAGCGGGQPAEPLLLSDPFKISVAFITEEQLENYKKAEIFIQDEEAPSLLILPAEALEKVTVCAIAYDADTEAYREESSLYSVSGISPDRPLILRSYLYDLPTLGVRYTDESGAEQFTGIGESQMDGSLYLFEIGPSKR